jgi:hypothetical protein
LPARLQLSQTHLDGAVLPSGLESEDSQCLGNDDLLLPVVWGRDALKELDALQGSGTSGSLVGHHPTDGAVENLARRAEVERTALLWVDEVALVQELVVAQLHPEERAGNVELL